MQTVQQALGKLRKSKFRSGFHLDDTDIAYIDQKGMDVIESHARDFVRERLAPAQPFNDGKQTPWKGHPVFKAQHATASCCRGCLSKWYKVQKGVPLSEAQQEKIVRLIMAWIKDEYERKKMPSGC